MKNEKLETMNNLFEGSTIRNKGYTQTKLRYYRKFYEVFSKCPTLSDELTYSHYYKIIWLDKKQIEYYINIPKYHNLSVRELRHRVKIMSKKDYLKKLKIN